MTRTIAVAVISSVVSCLVTLGAVSSGLIQTPPAAAQGRIPLVQAGGFEVVDVQGNRLAYLGEAQFSPAILEIGERNQILMSVRSRTEDQPRIELNSPDGTPLWRAP